MFLSINYDEPVIFSDTATLVILAVIGVIAALIALMVIVKAAGKKSKQEEAPAAEAQSVPAERAESRVQPSGTLAPAPGSQGDIDLYNVDDRTAAMLMAIIADDLKAELNTLRFLSIREVG